MLCEPWLTVTMRASGTPSSVLMLFRLLRTRFSQLACQRNNTTGFKKRKQVMSLNPEAKKTWAREVGEEQVRSDGDERRQTDLCLAHVGQRLFEMLRRSRRMARGQLARISKYKSRGGGEEHYSIYWKSTDVKVNTEKCHCVFAKKGNRFKSPKSART